MSSGKIQSHYNSEQLKNGTFFCSVTHPSCFAVGFHLLDDEFDWRCVFLGGRIPTTEGKLCKNLTIFFSRDASVVDCPIQFLISNVLL
jgi:hypothetical protein